MDQAQPFPAWIPCPDCEDMFCTIHQMHTHECPCPPIEEWEIDPYTAGGQPVEDHNDSADSS